jgi:hypothetical protein
MELRRVIIAIAALALVVGSSDPSSAAPPQSRGLRSQAKPSRSQHPFRTQGNDQDRRVDVNNLNMWVTNFGSYAYDIATGNAGLVYPRGSSNTAVFASGLWLGATVGGETRVTVAEYSQEFGPGKMVGGTFDNPNRSAYKTYKVARFTGNPEDTTHLEGEGVYPNDPLIHHSWNEYMTGAVPYGAPFKIYRLPVTATADPTDSVDVPGPDVLGDQMLWCVYNDGDPVLHNNNAGSTPPMGVEVQQTTFAFNVTGALGNTVFLKFKIINAGNQTLDNMFCSMWADPDLGGFTDDLVGCDTTLSLGFCYNATNEDQQYGGTPPAVGYDFFLGPINKVTGDTLGLVSFNKYINGTDPGSADETYNYMQGVLPDGSDLVDPNGVVTKFFHAGDPVTGQGWLDSNPADRRMLLNSGPFTMAPGDTQIVVGAVIIGQGKNRLSSVSSLKFFDTFAQAAFDSSFNLPRPPAQPKVAVATDHEQITLSWDAASRLNYSQPGYAFEGYNVYQSLSSSGPWTLLATYDEINQVRVIFDEQFDVETGQVIPEFPVAFGSDLGVRYSHTVTTDGIRGGPLRDGMDYYYAVTAYSFNPAGRPKVLENPQNFIHVIPQRGAAGTDYATASATPVTYFQKDTTKPPATDVVSVEVIDPNQVSGHIYKVSFQPTPPPPTTVNVGVDTATVLNSWSLIDSTSNTILLSGQLNRRGDDDYRIVDGLKVRVIGQYFPKLQDATYDNLNATNRRALEGVNFGLQAFGGGAGDPLGFLGASSIDATTQPDSFTTVELRFSRTATQKAYRFFRLEKASDGSAPPQGRAYIYGGYHTVPMQAWDTVNNKQLEIAFVERMLTADDGTFLPLAQQPATQDSTWGPDDDALGGREYLWVLGRTYPTDGAPVEGPTGIGHDGAVVDGTIPQMWTLIAKLRTADDIIDDGDKFTFLWANPAIPNDQYAFNTSALVHGNAALAGSKLDKIRIVPNPYYSHSIYETSQFNRIMRFVNLPEVCTIRIFNLAGDLVRTLQKTDPTTSIITWDLLTEGKLPVAGGVYICHIDAPGVGSTFKKIAVFVEKERLNNF